MRNSIPPVLLHKRPWDRQKSTRRAQMGILIKFLRISEEDEVLKNNKNRSFCLFSLHNFVSGHETNSIIVHAIGLILLNFTGNNPVKDITCNILIWKKSDYYHNGTIFSQKYATFQMPLDAGLSQLTGYVLHLAFLTSP